MLARDGRLLLLTAALLAGVACMGVGAAFAASMALPEEPDLAWAYPWSQDLVPPPAGERRTQLSDAVAQVDGVGHALLASPASRSRLHEASAELLAGGGTVSREVSASERRVAVAVREVSQSAEGSFVLACVLFGVAGASGLVSLLRLVVRGVTFVTCSVLVLSAAVGVFALVGLDAHPVWVIAPTVVCVLGFWGLLIGTHLLPDVNHAFIVAAEERLRVLSPRERRAFVLLRVGAGAALVAVAVLATAASYLFAVPGGVFAAYVGALASGLMIGTVPIIAAVRVGR